MKKTCAFLSLLSFLAACGEELEAPQETTESQALTQTQIDPKADPKDVIERGNLDDVARAAAAHDIEALNRLLPALYVVHGAVQIVQEGPIEDYDGLTSEVYVRSRDSAELQILTAEDAPMKLQLRDGNGRDHDIAFSQEQVEGGWWLIHVDPANLPAAGVLLFGPEEIDLTSIDINTFALAIVDDVWACEGAEAACAADDVACVIEAHAPCIHGSLESAFLTSADASPEELIKDYVQRHGTFGEVEATTERDGTLTLHYTGSNAPVSVIELAMTGDKRDLRWSKVDRNTISIAAPTDGFYDDSVIVLEGQGQGISKYGVGKGDIIFAAKSSHTWSMGGCLKFKDDGMNANDPILPLRRAEIRVSTSLGLGLYGQWGVVKTDGNGCFSAQKTFSGWFSKKKRKFRVKYRLHDGDFMVWNKFTFDGFVWGGFSELLQTGWMNYGNHSMGTRTFAPGEAGIYGVAGRRSQAVAFDALMKFNGALGGQNSWLKFNGAYHLNFPMNSSAWGITPPNPTGLIHTTYLSDDGLRTVMHEAAHAWHYKHKAGIIANIIPGFLGPIDIATNGSPWPWNWTISFDDWGTHNCQEDDNLAFLEGFAEYVAREVMCGAVFNSPDCSSFMGNPRELDNLESSWACINEGEPLLSTPDRVVHNDAGAMHGLQLLSVDNHYSRDYVHVTSPNDSATPYSGATFNKKCRWGDENFDLFDVMYAFRADASHGYFSNFPISNGNGLLEFYQRFQNIYETHPNFIAERMPFINPQTKYNPWQYCAKKCAYPAVMANGSSIYPTIAPTQCDVISAISSANITANGRKWYAQKEAHCAVGSYDGANCYVLTPASGTTPFIWEGNLYTSALPGNICPDGWYDGANCFIAATPPGTTPFIWEGNLYTSATYSCPLGVSISATQCLIGTTPPGTAATVTGVNLLGYTE